MPTQALPDIPDNLTRLVIHRSEFRLFSEQKSVDSDCYDEKVALEKVYERQKYLISNPQPGNQHQSRIVFVAVSIESHFYTS